MCYQLVVFRIIYNIMHVFKVCNIHNTKSKAISLLNNIIYQNSNTKMKFNTNEYLKISLCLDAMTFK